MSLLVSKSFLFFSLSLAGSFSLRSANSTRKLFMLSLKVNGGLQDNKASESQRSDGHGPAFSCTKASSDATARRAIDPCELQSFAEQLRNGLAVYLRLRNYPLCTNYNTKLVHMDASNGVLTHLCLRIDAVPLSSS